MGFASPDLTARLLTLEFALVAKGTVDSQAHEFVASVNDDLDLVDLRYDPLLLEDALYLPGLGTIHESIPGVVAAAVGLAIRLVDAIDKQGNAEWALLLIRQYVASTLELMHANEYRVMLAAAPYDFDVIIVGPKNTLLRFPADGGPLEEAIISPSRIPGLRRFISDGRGYKYASSAAAQSRASQAPAQSLSPEMRVWLQAELLDYAKAGATDEELGTARALFTSREVLAFYVGGHAAEHAEEKMRDMMRDLAFGVRAELRRRGYQLAPETPH